MGIALGVRLVTDLGIDLGIDLCPGTEEESGPGGGGPGGAGMLDFSTANNSALVALL